jgi:hypothetical protein
MATGLKGRLISVSAIAANNANFFLARERTI